MMTKIYTKNAVYQKFEVLKANRNKRYKYNEFFVEGVRNINEAVKNGWHICSFLYSSEKPLSRWAAHTLKSVKTDMNYDLTYELMKALSSKEDTSELLAVMQMREDDFSQFRLSDNPLIVLFDRPSNNGNLGTIIRSCDSFGIDGLIMTGHSVDLYEPEVISASMGSFFKVPVIRVADNDSVFSFIRKMKNKYKGFQVVASTAHDEKNIFDIDFRLPTMLMLGNETDGLRRTYKESCDILTTIPMDQGSSASSLNVACAASVMFYEAARQRF